MSSHLSHWDNLTIEIYEPCPSLWLPLCKGILILSPFHFSVESWWNSMNHSFYRASSVQKRLDNILHGYLSLHSSASANQCIKPKLGTYQLATYSVLHRGNTGNKRVWGLGIKPGKLPKVDKQQQEQMKYHYWSITISSSAALPAEVQSHMHAPVFRGQNTETR